MRTKINKLKNFWGNKKPKNAEKVAHVRPFRDGGTQLVLKKEDGTYRVDADSHEEHHVFFFNTRWEAYRRVVLNLHPRWKDPRDA